MRIAVVLTTLALVAGALAGCARDRRSAAEVVDDAMRATRDAVEDAVEDRARRAELLALVDELDGLLQAQADDLEELSRRLRRLNADPDATRSAFEASTASYQERRRARRARALDIHFAMIERTEVDEWERIVDRELEALEAMGRLEER
jgi:chlorite dismutase